MQISLIQSYMTYIITLYFDQFRENAMAKVDTSDLGPSQNSTTDKEGVNQELNGVDEEHKMIEGAGDAAAGQSRDNDLNLGQ